MSRRSQAEARGRAPALAVESAGDLLMSEAGPGTDVDERLGSIALALLQRRGSA